ncbi:MAG: FeoB-associated Cys-rich membrane protein [Desulfobacteraceae bacterium]|nr:FeoB-associated Cys-rich membrane protein [Desulfobacteraceae bacterium]MBC2755430.1 FeoB-associated Cys-rich membrane protein [Desulfobacteraceae bacterium]
MDIIIVSIIIAAAALYIGNIFFQKFKAARSGKSGCGCSTCPEGKNCNAAYPSSNNSLNQ